MAGTPGTHFSFTPFTLCFLVGHCNPSPQLLFQCCREAAIEAMQRVQALQHLQYWGAEASPGQLLVWMRSQHPSSDLPPLDPVSTLAPIDFIKYMCCQQFYCGGFHHPNFLYRHSHISRCTSMACGHRQGSPRPPTVILPVRVKQEEEGGTLVANPLRRRTAPPTTPLSSRWSRWRLRRKRSPLG